ncbi:SRPBCC family protein [Phreatobacter stygius]|uniref:Activator of Hsp90 ATPase homologue 1/2-like C-terminal domain-containing protein n=1 Tax=Phreatobacter stygius TaxID=1940610 RepID=A0A4D7ATS4_9HYPH|nr:SRPBCC domain-containing protein [Phreatobacter stygius]QCI63005.1 hypothetical protein E8M01_01355 [Phreatobacter stygius]
MKQPSETHEDPAALSFEVELEAPLAKVWRALTVPELVERWLPARPAGPRPGTEATQRPPAVRLDVLDCEPGQWIRYRWREAGGGLPDSVVTFRLDANAAGGTTLGIVHVVGVPVQALAPAGAANSNTPLMLRAA